MLVSAAWAMQDAELAPLQQLVTALEPIDPIARVVWLFDDWNPAIPEVDKSPSFDLAERTRERTIRDLLRTGGTAILLELAKAAKHPELVGAASGRVLATVEEFAGLVDAAMGKTDSLAIFASVPSAEAERRMGKAWHAQIQSWRGQRPWTDEQFANLVLNWNDDHATWDFVASLGDEVNRSYWMRKRPWAPRGLSPEDSEIAANSYIAVGRATAAIRAFGLNLSGLSTKTVFKILDSAVAELNESKQQINSKFVFELEQIPAQIMQIMQLDSCFFWAHCCGYVAGPWGCAVKCLHWIIVILGVSLFAVAPIVTRVDAPETAYDETDAPVNLATPIAVGINFILPNDRRGTISREQPGSPQSASKPHEVALTPGMHDSHSLLSLLCTFLC